MVGNLIFVIVLVSLFAYAIRFAEKERADGWTMFVFLCVALLFGVSIGKQFEEDARAESFDKYCHENAKDVYICDYRYPDENEPLNLGTGKYND